MKLKEKIPRVNLPTRKRVPDALANFAEVHDVVGLVESIATRIGSLPGMSCSDGYACDEKLSRRYYVDCRFVSDPPATEQLLFAVLNPDGRTLLHLPRPELEEVLRSGWGEFRGGKAYLFSPRDVGDLPVIWRIVLMAYFGVVGGGDRNTWSVIRSRRRDLETHKLVPGTLAEGAFF